jgi:hypothetical protein
MENEEIKIQNISGHEFPEEDDMQAFWDDPKDACE